MDTSESENSDADATDDDWVADDVDAADADLVVSGKQRVRKRNSKSRNHSSVGSHPSNMNDSGSLKSDNSVDGIVAYSGKSTTSVCCSCSRSSACKTKNCQCRSFGGVCGASCGCVPSKCSNREFDESLKPELGEGTENGLETDETKDRLLASHGAMLLHSALAEKPAETNDDGGSKRKPLSDIGNTLVSFTLSISDTWWWIVDWTFSLSIYLSILLLKLKLKFPNQFLSILLS